MINIDEDLSRIPFGRRGCMLAGGAVAAGAAAQAGTPRPVPMGGNPAAAATVRAASEAAWFEAIPGERMRIRIGGDDSGGALSVLESIVAPGAATPLHHHAAQETFLVLSGRLRLICGGVARDLTTGSGAIVPGGAHHGFINLSGAPVRMLALFSPGGIEGLFIQLQRTPPEQWGELARRFGTIIVGPPVTG